MRNKSIERVHSSSFVGSDVVLGDETIIGPNCYVDGKVTIGENVKLLGGLTLIGEVFIGDGCVLEPGVCFSNDGVQVRSANCSKITVIMSGVYIGAGSILLQGVKIGSNAKIFAGSVVSRDVPVYAIVQGNPSAILGYSKETTDGVETLQHKNLDVWDKPGRYECSVLGVNVYRFQQVCDLRGDLTVGEFPKDVPFNPKRYFLVYDVPSVETRGEHAHRKCHQFLICVAGSLSVVVDDGERREEILLNQPNLGLYIPAGVWGIQYKYSTDGVLLVFASEHYDSEDYIRDYEVFLKEKGLRL